MEIINFEDAKLGRQSKVRKQSKTRKQSNVGTQSKVRNQSKQNIVKHLPATDKGISELQRQYQNDAEFYNQWYYDHVIGQDKDGSWIYKD